MTDYERQLNDLGRRLAHLLTLMEAAMSPRQLARARRQTAREVTR